MPRNLDGITELPLILGGHSFITQLGNDPPASQQEQQQIVQSCLDHGIRWFDTTYQPERIALGRVLDALGRRDQARILAWNFFKQFSAGEAVGEAECYRPEHIQMMLEELRTGYIDCLVMVPLDDPEANLRQVELIGAWQRKGYVRSLALWTADPLRVEHYRSGSPFQYAIRPFNISMEDVLPFFTVWKRSGLKTLATSPFGRGWELERRIAEAVSRGHGKAETLRPVIADLMLRFCLFQRDIDAVIVAIRNLAWVKLNIASVSKGSLTDKELGWLRALSGSRGRKHLFWKRFRWF